MNYPCGKQRGIQQPKEKAYAASREESDPTRLNMSRAIFPHLQKANGVVD